MVLIDHINHTNHHHWSHANANHFGIIFQPWKEKKKNKSHRSSFFLQVVTGRDQWSLPVLLTWIGGVWCYILHTIQNEREIQEKKSSISLCYSCSLLPDDTTFISFKPRGRHRRQSRPGDMAACEEPRSSKGNVKKGLVIIIGNQHYRYAPVGLYLPSPSMFCFLFGVVQTVLLIL